MWLLMLYGFATSNAIPMLLCANYRKLFIKKNEGMLNPTRDKNEGMHLGAGGGGERRHLCATTCPEGRGGLK